MTIKEAENIVRSFDEGRKFTDEEEFSIIRPQGGGGTSFQCIFEYVREHLEEMEPTSIIILTDGYAPFPNEEDAMDIPVLWIINNEDVTPPWGKVARITNGEERDNNLTQGKTTAAMAQYGAFSIGAPANG